MLLAFLRLEDLLDGFHRVLEAHLPATGRRDGDGVGCCQTGFHEQVHPGTGAP